MGKHRLVHLFLVLLSLLPAGIAVAASIMPIPQVKVECVQLHFSRPTTDRWLILIQSASGTPATSDGSSLDLYNYRTNQHMTIPSNDINIAKREYCTMNFIATAKLLDKEESLLLISYGYDQEKWLVFKEEVMPPHPGEAIEGARRRIPTGYVYEISADRLVLENVVFDGYTLREPTTAIMQLSEYTIQLKFSTDPNKEPITRVFTTANKNSIDSLHTRDNSNSTTKLYRKVASLKNSTTAPTTNNQLVLVENVHKPGEFLFLPSHFFNTKRIAIRAYGVVMLRTSLKVELKVDVISSHPVAAAAAPDPNLIEEQGLLSFENDHTSEAFLPVMISSNGMWQVAFPNQKQRPILSIPEDLMELHHAFVDLVRDPHPPPALKNHSASIRNPEYLIVVAMIEGKKKKYANVYEKPLSYSNAVLTKKIQATGFVISCERVMGIVYVNQRVGSFKVGTRLPYIGQLKRNGGRMEDSYIIVVKMDEQPLRVQPLTDMCNIYIVTVYLSHVREGADGERHLLLRAPAKLMSPNNSGQKYKGVVLDKITGTEKTMEFSIKGRVIDVTPTDVTGYINISLSYTSSVAPLLYNSNYPIVSSFFDDITGKVHDHVAVFNADTATVTLVPRKHGLLLGRINRLVLVEGATITEPQVKGFKHLQVKLTHSDSSVATYDSHNLDHFFWCPKGAESCEHFNPVWSDPEEDFQLVQHPTTFKIGLVPKRGGYFMVETDFIRIMAYAQLKVDYSIKVSHPLKTQPITVLDYKAHQYIPLMESPIPSPIYSDLTYNWMTNNNFAVHRLSGRFFVIVSALVFYMVPPVEDSNTTAAAPQIGIGGEEPLSNGDTAPDAGEPTSPPPSIDPAIEDEKKPSPLISFYRQINDTPAYYVIVGPSGMPVKRYNQGWYIEDRYVEVIGYGTLRFTQSRPVESRSRSLFGNKPKYEVVVQKGTPLLIFNIDTNYWQATCLLYRCMKPQGDYLLVVPAKDILIHTRLVNSLAFQVPDHFQSTWTAFDYDGNRLLLPQSTISPIPSTIRVIAYAVTIKSQSKLEGYLRFGVKTRLGIVAFHSDGNAGNVLVGVNKNGEVGLVNHSDVHIYKAVEPNCLVIGASSTKGQHLQSNTNFKLNERYIAFKPEQLDAGTVFTAQASLKLAISRNDNFSVFGNDNVFMQLRNSRGQSTISMHVSEKVIGVVRVIEDIHHGDGDAGFSCRKGDRFLLLAFSDQNVMMRAANGDHSTDYARVIGPEGLTRTIALSKVKMYPILVLKSFDPAMVSADVRNKVNCLPVRQGELLRFADKPHEELIYVAADKHIFWLLQKEPLDNGDGDVGYVPIEFVRQEMLTGGGFAHPRESVRVKDYNPYPLETEMLYFHSTFQLIDDNPFEGGMWRVKSTTDGVEGYFDSRKLKIMIEKGELFQFPSTHPLSALYKAIAPYVDGTLSIDVGDAVKVIFTPQSSNWIKVMDVSGNVGWMFMPNLFLEELKGVKKLGKQMGSIGKAIKKSITGWIPKKTPQEELTQEQQAEMAARLQQMVDIFAAQLDEGKGKHTHIPTVTQAFWWKYFCNAKLLTSRGYVPDFYDTQESKISPSNGSNNDDDPLTDPKVAEDALNDLRYLHDHPEVIEKLSTKKDPLDGAEARSNRFLHGPIFQAYGVLARTFIPNSIAAKQAKDNWLSKLRETPYTQVEEQKKRMSNSTKAFMHVLAMDTAFVVLIGYIGLVPTITLHIMECLAFEVIGNSFYNPVCKNMSPYDVKAMFPETFAPSSSKEKQSTTMSAVKKGEEVVVKQQTATTVGENAVSSPPNG